MSGRGPRASGHYRVTRSHYNTAKHRLTVWAQSSPDGTTYDFGSHPLLIEYGPIVAERVADRWGSINSAYTAWKTASRIVTWLDQEHTQAPLGAWSDPRLNRLVFWNSLHEVMGWSPGDRTFVGYGDLLELVTGKPTGALPIHGTSNRNRGYPTIFDEATEPGTSGASHAYPLDEFEAIIDAAQGIFDDWWADHLTMLGQLGLPFGEQDAIAVTGDEIVRAAEAMNPPKQCISVKPLQSAIALGTAAYIVSKRNHLVHGTYCQTPYSRKFGSLSGVASGLISPPVHRRTAAAVLIAALVGLNKTPILGLRPDSFDLTGPASGRLAFVKDRSTGGEVTPLNRRASDVVRHLIALTSLTRHLGTLWVDANDPDNTEKLGAVDLLFSNLEGTTRGLSLRDARTHAGDPRAEVLSRATFRRLRGSAIAHQFLKSGRRRGPGQSRAMGAAYLRKFMPRELLDDALLRGQTDTVRAAVETAHKQRRDEAEGVLTSVANCSTHGQDPTGKDRPCSLGLIGCLLCPKAQVLPEHVPALVAAKQIGEEMTAPLAPAAVRDKGAALAALADATLRFFPAVRPSDAEVLDARHLVEAHLAIHQVVTR